MSSYLYGFIFDPIFPMVFSILRGNALIAKYVDSNAMVAPSGSTHQAENDCRDADVGSFNGYFLFDHLWHCIRDPLRITI